MLKRRNALVVFDFPLTVCPSEDSVAVQSLSIVSFALLFALPSGCREYSVSEARIVFLFFLFGNNSILVVLNVLYCTAR